MKNKLLTKKLVALGVTVLAVGSIYTYTEYSVKEKLKPTPVVVAIQDIPPHTKITNEMVREIRVPGDALPKSNAGNPIAMKTSEIVGKYTAPGYGISSKSFVNKTKVVKQSELPDAGILDLKPYENAFSFKVDINSTHGNALIPGQEIDLYFLSKIPVKTNKDTNDSKDQEYVGYDENVPVFGRVAPKVRIVSVKDRQAQDAYTADDYTVNEKDKKQNKKKLASIVTVAVDLDTLQYLNKAKLLGTIVPVPDGQAYKDVDLPKGLKFDITPSLYK